MNNNENRRLFLQKFGLISLAAGPHNLIPVNSFATLSESKPVEQKSDLVSFAPSEVFSVLDPDLPELASVRQALESKGHQAGLTALLEYFLLVFPSKINIVQFFNFKNIISFPLCIWDFFDFIEILNNIFYFRIFNPYLKNQLFVNPY